MFLVKSVDYMQTKVVFQFGKLKLCNFMFVIKKSLDLSVKNVHLLYVENFNNGADKVYCELDIRFKRKYLRLDAKCISSSVIFSIFYNTDLI